jgi:trans-aconitate methyltransferase
MRDWDGVLRYWRNRHRRERGSWESVGRGSVGRLARYKATLVDGLVQELGATRIIDLGCGDGRQADRFHVPEYVGLEVSDHAVAEARKRLSRHPNRTAHAWKPGDPIEHRGCIALSMDVVFHLVDDDLFVAYMDALFSVGVDAVAIYSTDHEGPVQGHVRHRNVSEWVAEHKPEWTRTTATPPPWPNKDTPRHGSDCWWLVWRPTP